MPSIKAKRLNQNARIPTRATEGSAGFDLYADFTDEGVASTYVFRNNQRLIKTGISLEIPPGYVGLVCPRSGLSLKYGITVHNGPGVIDQDYRGDVGVILTNSGEADYPISQGDKIAQLVVVPALHIHMIEAYDIENTDRGAGGFGHTGK